MSTFVISNDKILNVGHKLVSYSPKMNIDGIEYLTRLKYYHEFEVTLGYLNKTDMDNLVELKNGSFLFYPYLNTDPTASYFCIIDSGYNFESQFYLNGSYNSDEIKIRLMQVDG